MTPRGLGFFVMAVAAVAGGVALKVGLNPCVTASVAFLLWLIGLSVAMAKETRERLASNRAALMREAKMCPACGYFIRVDTDRCPECGKPVRPAEKSEVRCPAD